MLEPDHQQMLSHETASLAPFSGSKYPSLLVQSTTCATCALNSSKYKCPKCYDRTCSLGCFKKHKESGKCVVQSVQWKKIDGFSEFNDEVSINDQQFIHRIDEKMKTDKKRESVQKEQNNPTKIQLSSDQRFLLQNAKLRRIWLHLDGKNGSFGSRHERFSDTIFWTCTVKFVSRCSSRGHGFCQRPSDKAVLEHSNVDPALASLTLVHVVKPIVDYNGSDDEEMEKDAGNDFDVLQAESSLKLGVSHHDDGIGAENNNSDGFSDSTGDEDEQQTPLEWVDFTVENIPENIRVATLLHQFLRPKPHGPVVTLSQIDMVKMAPFISASKSLLSSPFASTSPDKETADKLLVYLEVSLSDEIENKLNDEQPEDLRYYVVDPNRTILDNLRNRHVNGHPCFVVVLSRHTEFGELELPLICEEEQKQLQKRNSEREQTINERPKWQRKNQVGMRRSNFNWRGRRGARGSSNGHSQQQQRQPVDAVNAWSQNQREESFSAAAPNCQPFAAFHPYQRPIPGQNQQWRGASQQRGTWNGGGSFYNNTMYNRSRGGF
ncbi:hypothetical protein niasHT_010345 [Heterodera trifolii]|uniref:HIT-type domain-containing protein n=1 Tax=Heterodera trifolii TaxID=157864 RepID=A0ABD2M8T6_9BILA